MKIGIFSPSTSVVSKCPNRVNRALEYLKSQGNELVLGELFFNDEGYRTGSIKQRAAEINNLLKDEDLDVLMSSIGGFDTNSILPHLDYELLENRKRNLVICGFSDITVLLLGAMNRIKSSKIRFLYGPALIPSFGDIEPEFKSITYNSLLDCVLSSKKHIYNVPGSWTDDWKNWEDFEQPKQIFSQSSWKYEFFKSSHPIKGRLIGGNVNAMLGTFGSEYGLKIQPGDVLLLEDSCKNAEVVEKNFSACLLNGIFDQVSAIILGKYEKFDDQGTGVKPIEILREILDEAKKEIPIVYDVDFSHTKPMLVVELNKPIIIDGKKQRIIKPNP